MEIKVLVAAHKNYQMPDDKLYLPVFVGKELRPDVNHSFQGDNTGDNMSAMNPYYNELTAIYWGWKNLDLDAMGLVHYRRYLSLNHQKSLNKVLSYQDAERLLKNNDIILKKGQYLSDKQDKQLHGIGISSVKTIVEKYQGTLDISYDTKTFRVTILIEG